MDISGLLQRSNHLVVHFHNIKMEEAKYYYNPEWEGMVDHWKTLRKPGHDRIQDIPHGSNYQGAHPYFTPIGLYDDVWIDYPDGACISGDHIATRLLQDTRWDRRRKVGHYPICTSVPLLVRCTVR